MIPPSVECGAMRHPQLVAAPARASRASAASPTQAVVQEPVQEMSVAGAAKRATALVTFLDHYRHDGAKCKALCDELAALPSAAIEACIPQICQSLLQGSAGAKRGDLARDCQHWPALERCLAQFCSRSTAIAFQANWWLQASIADPVYGQRCAELWALCERACTSSADVNWLRQAEQCWRETTSAAHELAEVCTQSSSMVSCGTARNALAMTSQKAVELAETWGGGTSTKQAHLTLQKLVKLAQGLLLASGDGPATEATSVIAIFGEFLNVAADAGDLFGPMAQAAALSLGNIVGGRQTVSNTDGIMESVESADARISRCSPDVVCSCDLFKRELRFVQRLEEMSFSLRLVPPEERPAALREELEKLNREQLDEYASRLVACMRENAGTRHEAQRLASSPVVFPIDSCAVPAGFNGRGPMCLRSGVACRRVLRVVPETARVLNSRERAPILLQFELLSQPLQAAPSKHTGTNDLAGQKAAGTLGPAPARVVSTNMTAKAEATKTLSLRPKPEVSTKDFTNGFGVVFRAETSAPGSPSGAASPIDLFESLPESPTATLGRAVSTMYPQSPGYADDGTRRVFEGEAEVATRLAASSAYAGIPGWEIGSLIVKSGDDIRQEQLAASLIEQFSEIFADAGLDLWLRPYKVVAVSPNSGLIELLPSVLSVHAVKQTTGKATLREVFVEQFGPNVKGKRYTDAQRRFAQSMAGYSLLCYLLQIKDRHNGNLLLDHVGHIIHIDFGFLLSSSPGGNMNFESAPFKLSQELVDVMVGDGDKEGLALFSYFEQLCVDGFIAARRQYPQLALQLQIARAGPELPCFNAGERVLENFRDRFMLAIKSEQEVAQHVRQLVEESVSSWRAAGYDAYQRLTNGIL